MTCSCSRFIRISGKCNDLCSVSYKGHSKEGYMPSGLSVGRGDYIDFAFCADCGKIKNFSPISEEDALEAVGVHYVQAADGGNITVSFNENFNCWIAEKDGKQEQLSGRLTWRDDEDAIEEAKDIDWSTVS